MNMKAKNYFTYASVGLALIVILIFVGNITYHMATGSGAGDVVCDNQHHCYDSFCVWVFLGVFIFISLLYFLCMSYCQEIYQSDPEVLTSCVHQCAAIYVSWVLVTFFVLYFLCSAPSPQ
jgi:hypothetical protein